MYRKTILINSFLAAFFALLVLSCSSDDKVDTVQTCKVNVTLQYPENSIQPYEGAKVELVDARASVFEATTNAKGVAEFNVRPAFTMFVVVQHVAMEHGNSTLMETKARLLCRHPLRK